MMHGMRRIANTSDERARDSSQVVMRLLRYLRPYWPAVLGALILVLINAGTQALGPFLVGRAIDEYQ